MVGVRGGEVWDVLDRRSDFWQRRSLSLTMDPIGFAVVVRGVIQEW